jgi:hypothetical protein
MLGSGTSPDTTDPVIQALHAWRTDITADLDHLPATPPNGHRQIRRMRSGATPGDASQAEDGTSHHRAQHRRRPARRRASFAAVAVGLTAGLSGIAVAAADAGPGSPLWPITKVIYSDVAAERQAEADAEAALDRARRALAEGRVDEAERLLDEANRKAGAVRSPEAEKLRENLNEVRSEIEKEQTDSSASESSDPSEAPEPPVDDGDAVPSPEVPTSTPSSGVKDEKGKGGPGGGKRQQSTQEGLEISSPDPTSSG